MANIVSGEPPAIDLAAEKRLQDCLVALASAGTLESAHDISDGGLAVTLAESCFASVVAGPETGASRAASQSTHLGAIVDIRDNSPCEHALFGERGARAIVSLTPSKLAAVLDTARQYNVAAQDIGKVTVHSIFHIDHNSRAVVDAPLDPLRDAWANSLERTIVGRRQ
jgi:phosphoribosylformylglycinamidine (FGAM) synthase-like enzyme